MSIPVHADAGVLVVVVPKGCCVLLLKTLKVVLGLL